MRATRTLSPGALRASERGEQLCCVLLAPLPDFVALDLATGALVRAPSSAMSTSMRGVAPSAPGDAEPLASVVITLGSPEDSSDPSRPEAVTALEIAPGGIVRRRSLARLLESVARPVDEQGLLGTVGPSLAYGDLTGSRPSVAVLAPSGGRAWLSSDGTSAAVHFRLAGRDHTLPLRATALSWAESMVIGPGRVRGRRGRSRSGALGRGPRSAAVSMSELARPVLLTVGLDLPRDGQVRKVVLGVVPGP